MITSEQLHSWEFACDNYAFWGEGEKGVIRQLIAEVRRLRDTTTQHYPDTNAAERRLRIETAARLLPWFLAEVGVPADYDAPVVKNLAVSEAVRIADILIAEIDRAVETPVAGDAAAR